MVSAFVALLSKVEERLAKMEGGLSGEWCHSRYRTLVCISAVSANINTLFLCSSPLLLPYSQNPSRPRSQRVPDPALTFHADQTAVTWAAGPLDCWAAGLLGCWAAGLLGYRLAGLLACWLGDWLGQERLPVVPAFVDLHFLVGHRNTFVPFPASLLVTDSISGTVAHSEIA